MYILTCSFARNKNLWIGRWAPNATFLLNFLKRQICPRPITKIYFQFRYPYANVIILCVQEEVTHFI